MSIKKTKEILCAHCLEEAAVGVLQEFVPEALAGELTALGKPISSGWTLHAAKCRRHLDHHLQLMLEDVPLEYIRVTDIDEYKKIKGLVD